MKQPIENKKQFVSNSKYGAVVSVWKSSDPRVTKCMRRRGLDGARQQGHLPSVSVLLHCLCLILKQTLMEGQCCSKRANRSKSYPATGPETEAAPRERRGVISLVKTYGFVALSLKNPRPKKKTRLLNLWNRWGRSKTSQKKGWKADDKKPHGITPNTSVEAIE